MLRITISLLVSTLVTTLPAQAQWRYRTGFESAPFIAGQPLCDPVPFEEGQDGWIGVFASGAAEVVSGDASAGRNAVRAFGADLEPVPGTGLAVGDWGRPTVFDPIATGRTRVRVQCDMRLDGPDTGSGPGADLLSANLFAGNTAGEVLAGFFFSSNGNAYPFSHSDGVFHVYEIEEPVTLGQYSTFAFTLDYRTHVATFEVDGIAIGALPFGVGAATEEFWLPVLEMAALDDPLLVDRSLYTAWWDNLSVLATPALPQ